MSAVRVKAAALLLDMDGTLVHSTGDVEVVWRRWCQHHGLDPAPVLAMCHGVRSREVIGALAPQLDVAVYLFTRTGLTASVLPGWDNLSSRCTP